MIWIAFFAGVVVGLVLAFTIRRPHLGDWWAKVTGDRRPKLVRRK